MKNYLQLILFLLFSAQVCLAQSFLLGDSVTFNLGSSASFYAGGNTTLNGVFNNQGTIISYSDLGLKANNRPGNIRFVGDIEQTLRGQDTVWVNELTMAKTSVLNLEVARLIVEGKMEIISGVLGAGSDTTLLISGEIIGGSRDGFIEGKLVHLTNSDVVNFPLGVNGFYNALTLNNVPLKTVLVVECRVPDPDRLKPTEDMIGISDEVEWVVTTMKDSIEVRASAIFNGIDLSEFSNGRFVRAQDSIPALVKFGKSDTIYYDLGVRDLTDTDKQTFGTIDSESTFFISKEPTFLSIALIPVLLQPEFFVPSAFSPNGVLEENRVFRPYFAGEEVSFVSMKVWDSFQNSVYSISLSGEDLDLSGVGWNGLLSNGEIADEGVYYFSINLRAADEDYKEKGSFLLVN